MSIGELLTLIAIVVALGTVAWQVISRRSRITAKIRYTGVYGENDIEKCEIIVNIRNLKHRTIKIFGVGFEMSNGNNCYPEGWNEPRSLQHETDIDYVVDIDGLEERISDYEPGSKIVSAYYEESEAGHVRYIKIPKEIKKTFNKFNTQN